MTLDGLRVIRTQVVTSPKTYACSVLASQAYLQTPCTHVDPHPHDLLNAMNVDMNTTKVLVK